MKLKLIGLYPRQLHQPDGVINACIYDYLGTIRFGVIVIFNGNYLYDAYFGGNLRLVEKFESLGYLTQEFSLEKAVKSINLGYSFRYSNPVSVYHLLQNKPELLSKTFDVLLLDIDISRLIELPTDCILRGFLSNNSGQVGNVNFLSWIISNSSTGDIYEELPPDYLPISRQILNSHFK